MMAQDSVTDTAVFQLGKLGQAVTSRFAEALAPLGLRPRHCGVLEVLTSNPMAQLDLSRFLGVTPSVIVDMLDELQELGAIRRVRDTADRRRQLIELTDEGRALAHHAVLLARRMDTELFGALDPGRAAALRESLSALAATYGVPGAARGHDR
jgi:DNA-binding MarR family transcriptional regulator